MSFLIFKDQHSFMRFFDQKPSDETSTLYRKLIDEEYAELVEAWSAYSKNSGSEQVTEIADACLDLIYVISGLMHGLGLDPQPLWDEVHQTNINKIKHVCSDCHGSTNDNSEPADRCETCNGQGFVYEVRRREDGKILKPAHWTPPQLQPLVESMLKHKNED